MLSVLLLTLTAAWITQTAGLSLALGAFLAGMMLGETEYRHQVESDMLPFRDILLGLFFITVGMQLDTGMLSTHWLWILAAVAGLFAFKTALIALLGRLFKIELGVALRTGLVLSQGGEFGFALLLQANEFNLLGAQTSQFVLATVVLSMMLAPLVVRYNGRLARRLVPGYTHTRDQPRCHPRRSRKRDRLYGRTNERSEQGFCYVARPSPSSRRRGDPRGPPRDHLRLRPQRPEPRLAAGAGRRALARARPRSGARARRARRRQARGLRRAPRGATC